MTQALAFMVSVMVAAGCGKDQSPSPAPQGEYEKVRGPELSRAKKLHAAGKIEEAVAILRSLAADADWEVRSRAIGTIGELRERKLLPELHRALKDPMVAIRERASRVLQWTGDASSIEPLEEALSETDPAVRGNVVEALALVGREKELLKLRNVLQRDRDEGVRARAAAALGAAHIPGAVDALVAALGDPSLSVRARAAEALGEIGDPRAGDALKRTARSDVDSGVRAVAATAISRLRAGERQQ